MSSTSSVSQFLQSLSLGTIAWILVGLYAAPKIAGGLQSLFQPLSSPLRNLPGPKKYNLLWGNLKEIFQSEGPKVQEGWIKEFGPVIRYRIAFGKHRLFTTDTRAVTHILSHAYKFPKPDQLRNALGDILGRGLLFAEGDDHKRQRRIMNPSFGPAQIRSLTPVFLDKSQELRDVLLKKITESGSAYETDVLPWLSRATLDVIGIAGFDYQFSALSDGGEANELAKAIGTVFSGTQEFSYFNMLRQMFPVLKIIPDNSERAKKVKQSNDTMRRIGLELVQGKKAAVIAAAGKGGAVEKSNVTSRDLLSLLIKANMASDIPDTQKMSDEEVLAQISTFLVAGHETTSSSTAWALIELANQSEIQSKLRAELAAVSTDNLTMDELNALPYLDAVVREALRLRAVVVGTVRNAAEDCVVPVSKPFKDANGVMRNEIRMRKGESVFLPILPLNRSNEIWGDDARVFNPERWIPSPEKSTGIPSVYSHLGTFLAGPHACIGHRFAVVEMKALLFMLIRDISFELAVPFEDIEGKTSIVTRPLVKSQKEKGHQLPMRLRAVRE
ncbi:hypothetical protein BOTBODRAFT_106698 [Botryobasidium botryosum FD-172 SS1]|uniref:Cytochrome P450 n=1 Tax=Botryobasidium botryosum (strain FD-172 SS1) TaxID=930990 RepID=A0A067MPP9_BOTB1|nr:hypothetical protein BOTBODRAFT_106698 [Botryobasidium botryosum FD-172 SS1]